MTDTAAQIRRELDVAEARGMEKAAKICEARKEWLISMSLFGMATIESKATQSCVDAIRLELEAKELSDD
jgi:hypothetical protein